MLRRMNQWQRVAEKLAQSIPKDRLHPSVLREAKGNVANGWAVAFSGGADSLALLLLLWAHWPQRRKKLIALHFNHRLRGRAAEMDERFCRNVCAGLKVRFRSGNWKGAPKSPSEAYARAARHAFFARELNRARTDVLWLGHQQDDIAETMLMRLARGSGLSGLAAPRPVHRMGRGYIHLRPLLSLSKHSIEIALRRAGAKWRNDATNATEAFLRNRVRHTVVPAWRAAVADRDLLAGVALARERIDEDDAALDHWVGDLGVIGKRGELRLTPLAGKPRGVVRRALQHWLSHHGRAGTISRQAFERLLDDVVQVRITRQSLGTGVFAVIGKRSVTMLGAETTSRNSTAAPIDL